MNKIKSWIHDKWFWLRFYYYWYQLDQEGRLECLREARYTYWRQHTSADKLSPYHRIKTLRR